MNNSFSKTMLAGLCAAGLALAATAGAADAPGGRKMRLPVPTKVVHPRGLPSCYEDAAIKFALTIDESGVPRDIAPAERMPKDLAERLLPVVAQWRFTPCTVDGRPVRKRVVLPIKLVDEEGWKGKSLPRLPGVAVTGGPGAGMPAPEAADGVVAAR